MVSGLLSQQSSGGGGGWVQFSFQYQDVLLPKAGLWRPRFLLLTENLNLLVVRSQSLGVLALSLSFFHFISPFVRQPVRLGSLQIIDFLHG